MSNEMLTIDNCPLCNQSHVYRMEVERSLIIKYMLASDFNEKPKQKKVKRIFICPVKNERFEAILTLFETSSDQITNVTISNDPGE